ncbi:cytochrome P450 [Scytonema sp. NUACC21]
MPLPQGPKTPPFVQLLQWITNPFDYMESCAQRYGDIFTLRIGLGFRPLVYVSNPQALQQILTNDMDKTIGAPGEANTIFEPFLGTQGIMTQSGIRHTRKRRLLIPPFHGERMREYGSLIEEITKQVFFRGEVFASNNKTKGKKQAGNVSRLEMDKPFSVRECMQAISMRVILRAVFGLSEGERYWQIEQLLHSMMDVISSPLQASQLFFPILQQDLGAWSPWGRFLRKRQQLDELLYAEIRERRAYSDPSRIDVLSLLMSARDDAGEAMTDLELRDELMTLLVGGYETTGTVMTWALYWIHQLPSVREKLLEELDSLGDTPDKSDIVRLPYLSAVCSETLRIYPVGPLLFPRVVRSPITLLGHDLEPGTELLGCIYLTHQREDTYPQAKEFKPERFLEKRFSPYEYLPFGAGARRCVGDALAQYEMKIVLATILSQLELSLTNSHPARITRRGFLSAPDNVEMVVTGQRQKQPRLLAIK